MVIASDKQTTRFWGKTNFWNHLAILFAVFVYFYSPIIDHALGHHIHSRPHNHIPINFAHEHNHFSSGFMHGHNHFHHDHHHHAHGTHAYSEATDSHICSLEIEGLILLGIFLTFIALARQPIRNIFVFKVKTGWTKISLVGQPPPNPPPRFCSLTI